LLEDDNNIKTQNQVGLIVICEFSNDLSKRNITTSFGEESTNGRLVYTTPPLIICTTHLKSSKSFVGERYRQKAILQVLDRIDDLYRFLSDIGRPPAVLLTGVYFFDDIQ
jgi:hypothetical protein